jgi:micrococcal nuclease
MFLRTLLFVVLIPLYGYPQLVGKVVSIADGDTFTLLVDSQQIRIRLHGIDCPEKGQDYSLVAKDFLASYIFGRTVLVTKKKTDRYRRIVGIVTVDGANINEKILEVGLAWHYTKYDKNVAWARLEQEARENKRGIWQKPDPIPPWEWRRKKSLLR